MTYTPDMIVDQGPTFGGRSNFTIEEKRWLELNFAIIRDLIARGVGTTDTFTTVDGKTVTVTDGVITGIV